MKKTNFEELSEMYKKMEANNKELENDLLSEITNSKDN